MNNRYFGNIHDFCKYGLLRLLVKQHLLLGVCWMQTADKKDGKESGEFGYEYLSESKRWLGHDPKLFERLGKWRGELRQSSWGIHLLQDDTPELINGAYFYGGDNVMPVALDQREAYFDRMLDAFEGRDVIFLDPDYGLGLSDLEFKGERGGGYLRASEVARCFEAGHSVLFYQHWRRGRFDESDPTHRVLAEMRQISVTARVLRPHGIFEKGEDHKSHACFFLLTHPKHANSMNKFVNCFCNSRFSPEPRVGVFVDFDNVNSKMGQDAHRYVVYVLRQIRQQRIAGRRNPSINGWVFAQECRKDLVCKLCKETGMNRIIVPNDKREQADIELTDKAKELIDRGEIDDVVVLSADGDYKMIAGLAAKYSIPYYGVGNENQKDNDYAELCEGFFWVDKEVTSVKGRRGMNQNFRTVEFKLKGETR